jgi:hypothetical protein
MKGWQVRDREGGRKRDNVSVHDSEEQMRANNR